MSALTHELAPAYRATRARLGLVVLLLAIAGGAWWLSAARMDSMNAMQAMQTGGMRAMSQGSSPTVQLGTLGWFIVTWVVMMAAMMLPSLAPTAALYARLTRDRGPIRALLFTAGYLIVWGAAGAVAYGLYVAGDALFGHVGSAVAAGVVALAAVYQLSPLKNVCLGKCRGPLGFLLSSWREGPLGALRMGGEHALWCLGCCWALMAALFALGIMSLGWMAVVAALIAIEKTLPWRRLATGGTSLLLFGLAGAMLAGAVA